MGCKKGKGKKGKISLDEVIAVSEKAFVKRAAKMLHDDWEGFITDDGWEG
jgi:hypothetical protein